ncbi:hypothetical protein SAMN02745163_04490 [Clostridium cavendishii DSM 21758]|uniref:Uncharacterized protein n=1 Tax=Clostridium cavendishii DSM 21758 TaxID=1121302 RepID=A0A1M6VFW0_9CLOT|nr:hypothetical protein [Clostridium cavendishii]SHK80427.1 hypothetical protein SAMN02745163_04490 [Clostridium cavendishii DSM 21758]
MIRTVVCEKEKCNGNSFHIETKDNNLILTCTQCETVYKFDISYYEFIMLSNCCSCNNDSFKVFKDTEKEGVYAKCTKCGNPPEKIYLDSDGNQVSYEGKVLNDIKEIIYKLDQRVFNVERKIEGLESSNELLEESLAYITKFLSN